MPWPATSPASRNTSPRRTSSPSWPLSVRSILLTFLGGAEIDPVSRRRHWKASISIGVVSFALQFLAAFGFFTVVLCWHPHAPEIGGVALSTTSAAVVYAVMVETGVNRQDIVELIRAAVSSLIWAPCWLWAVFSPPTDGFWGCSRRRHSLLSPSYRG